MTRSHTLLVAQLHVPIPRLLRQRALHHSSLIIGLLSCLMLSPLTHAADDTRAITVLPDAFVLDGPTATQPLLVHERIGSELGHQLSDSVTWSSSDESVVTVVGQAAIPRGNGTATLTASVNGQQATTTVTVQAMDTAPDWSFRHDVLPVFSRLGCNSGACHGALAGKGGFRLSLRGYDPASDHHNLTKQARGRRVELAAPSHSLVLTKPTGAVPHKGGVKFATDSLEYQILSEWIMAGAPGPHATDPTVERLEVFPPTSLQQVGDRLQVFVWAHFSDGTVQDVTRWAKFASADEAVARVDEHGQVEVVGSGEGAITAWYSSKIALARVTSPFGSASETHLAADLPEANLIDVHVNRQLQRLRLPASPPSTDGEFVRRAFLDTIGRLPTLDETQSFLADTNPAKRQQLIDALLARDEFVDYWTYRLSDILLINGAKLRPDAVKAFYQWIHENVAQNTPWDEFVRQVVTAKGSSVENGATNFYALHQDPEAMTENICQAFMGLSIGCAKCHNHPLEKWTNDQYYAMANLFARVRAKGWGGDPRNGDGVRTVYVTPTGDLIQPLRGEPQPPTPLDGEPLPIDDPSDRREYLADWLTSPDNPYFARAITNRIWANFFGVGLIEAVDDLRVSNPASNEPLLNAAADYLVAEDYDLKALMRLILNSAAYQRSSQAVAGNEADQRFYSRYYPRRLMAEVLLDAISDVTAVPTEFNEIVFPGADVAKTEFYPEGTRALELYDSAVKSYFLKTFGRNTRDITCECERSNEPSMVQVLHLSNGSTLNGKLAAEQGRVSQLLESELSNAELVEQAYLLCFSRSPTPEEATRLVELLDSAGDQRRVFVEDLFWSLMTSREFLFNH